MRKFRFRRIIFLATVLFAHSAFGWGPEGHRIVARIAATHLSAGAQAGVKTLLKSDPLSKSLLSGKKTGASALSNAMAAVANWADDVKKETGTGSWHFLDLAASDGKPQLAARCPHDDCNSEKIRAMAPNLKPGTDLP